MASIRTMTVEAPSAPSLSRPQLHGVAMVTLALLTAQAAAHPMLDAITNWVKKAGSTKLGEATLSADCLSPHRERNHVRGFTVECDIVSDTLR